MGGSWKVFPNMGIPGIRGGRLYFWFQRWLEITLSTIRIVTNEMMIVVHDSELGEIHD